MDIGANPQGYVVRRLRSGDAQVYRSIRLEGLRINPEAFGGALEDEEAQPLEQSASALERNFVVGAFAGDHLAGVAGMFIRPPARLRHKAVLYGMFVQPGSRGQGVGALLLDAILRQAERLVEEIQLTVVASNAAALALYTAAGFERYGLERRALKVGSDYYDEILMSKPLVPTG